MRYRPIVLGIRYRTGLGTQRRRKDTIKNVHLRVLHRVRSRVGCRFPRAV
jgi:hypothetical protein